MTPTPNNFYDEHATNDATKISWTSENERDEYHKALRQGLLFEFCDTFSGSELDEDAFQFQKISPRESDLNEKD